MPDEKDITVDPARARMHMLSEGLAITVVAPYLLHLASKSRDPTDRLMLTGIGLGTLLVDGYLLSRWTRK